MRYLILILLFISCGKNSETIREALKQQEVKVPQDFEGYYECSNNGRLELYVDYANRVTFETSGQSLNSVNPKNSTIGTHPIISDKDLIITGNKIVLLSRNYNYSSTTYDIEEDITGNDITGNRKTDISLTLLNDKSISLVIDIWEAALNSDINSIIAHRVISCERL